MSEWREVRLGDLCYKVCSGGTPKSTCSAYYDGGTIPWLNTKEINYNRIYQTESHITEEGLNNSSAKWIDANSVIVAMYGATAGRVAVAKIPMTTNQACCNLMIDKSKADYNFIYYYLSNNYKHLLSMANGAAQQNLNAQVIKDFIVSLPEIDEQHRISSFLSSLDDKIAVNRRICENLEAQAQALFKHWFIDFAPFLDKPSGKAERKNGNFVESELGMIPEGWRVGTLTEIAEYLNGLAMQKFPPLSADDAIPVLKIKELGQSQCDDSSDKCSKQIKPEYIINNGDVVFSWSGTLMVDIWCGGICGLNQHLFKVTSDHYPKWFYLMWTKHHLAEFIRIAKDKAVTMGHIKRGDLEKALVAIPDSDTLDKMSKVMEDIHNQIINTRLESNSLSTLRDTLLPKLMSGQIKV